MKKGQMGKEERQIRSEMTRIIQYSDIMRANMVTMARECGNKNCKCARGEKHVSLYVSRSYEGKQRLTYVPCDMEKRIHKQVEKYQHFKRLLDRLLDINWERFVQEKKR